MVLSTISFASIFGSLIDSYIDKRQRVRFLKYINTKVSGFEDLSGLDLNGDKRVDLAEWLKHFLGKIGGVDPLFVDELLGQFYALDRKGNGYICKEDWELSKTEITNLSNNRARRKSISSRHSRSGVVSASVSIHQDADPALVG